ncbi:outer membrane beta-barrel family protein [Aquirufa rosea]|uniref:TonB-dependent receptor n=1 Tax=Aquirufa rosea TaxID=2509241 RepID=A0A4Q1C0P6_9BACT|nr:outer membrane beta-barrel family protein [Aquirufa rosea]RXK50656.1 TonB-dependent receptor [Aquirufa rosea]
MKTFILSTFMAIITPILAFADNGLSAKIRDEKNQPVPFASVILRKASDSTLVKGFITDENGELKAAAIPQGNYTLKIQFTGYKAFTKNIGEVNANTQIDLGVIALEPATTELTEVIVKATKPFIEKQLDKTVVNVENSVMAAGNSAMEVLERSPGVIVDKDGNISLRGKQGVKVMIDGKVSYLSGNDLSNFLRNLSADQISQLEIMTNPSSKYDAAGTAGIINIKMKKNANMGMNGSVNGSIGQGVYTRSSAGLNLNYRNKGWNVFGNASYFGRNNLQHNDITRYFRAQNEVWSSSTDLPFKGTYTNLKAGADWTVNEKTTLGVLFSGGLNQTTLNNGLNQSIQRNLSTNAIMSKLDTYNSMDNPFHNFANNFNLKHTFDSTGKELTVDLDYARFVDKNQNDYLTQWYGSELTKIKNDSLLRTGARSFINQYSLKSDFVLPISKTSKWGMGVKSSYVKTDNDLQFRGKTAGEENYTFLYKQSNRFMYEEQIHAAYLNTERKIGKWSYQIGLRGEWTIADGKSMAYENAATDSSFHRDYKQLFPSAFLQYEVNKNHTLGLNYSRRINRPGYSDLNPFVFFLDNYTYQVGNPMLMPQLTNSFELTHTFKGAFNSTFGYSHTNDVITQLLRQDTEARKTYQTSANLAQRTSYSLSFSLPIPVTKWWTSNTDIQLNRNELVGKVDDAQLNQSGNMFYINSNHTFTLNNGFKLEMGGQFFSGGLEQAFNFGPGGSLNLGIQKSILNKKGTISLNANDILYTRNPKAFIKYGDIDITVKNRNDTRVIRFNFTYRFGNTAIKGARSRNTGLDDEKGRVKTAN